jgi:hypothetical protein
MHKLEQVVIQDGLQMLLFHQNDMHKLTPKIEEDMEFQRGLSIKEFLEFFKVWRI